MKHTIKFHQTCLKSAREICEERREDLYRMLKEVDCVEISNNFCQLPFT